MYFDTDSLIAMLKTTFYFVIVVLAFCDVVQSRYQRKLIRQKKAMLAHNNHN